MHINRVKKLKTSLDFNYVKQALLRLNKTSTSTINFMISSVQTNIRIFSNKYWYWYSILGNFERKTLHNV